MKKILYTIGLLFCVVNIAMAVPTYFFNNSNSYDVTALAIYYSSPAYGMGCYDGDMKIFTLPSTNVMTNVTTGAVVPYNMLDHAYVCSVAPSPACGTTTDVIFKSMRFATTVPGFGGMAGTGCSNFIQTPMNGGGWIISVSGAMLTCLDLGFMKQYIFT